MLVDHEKLFKVVSPDLEQRHSQNSLVETWSVESSGSFCFRVTVLAAGVAQLSSSSSPLIRPWGLLVLGFLVQQREHVHPVDAHFDNRESHPRLHHIALICSFQCRK